MPCLPKLAAALALAAVAAWLVRNRPEQDPETYPVQPVDPWLMRDTADMRADIARYSTMPKEAFVRLDDFLAYRN